MSLLSNPLEVLQNIHLGNTHSACTQEAARCLQCEEAPCSKACPAGIDIRRFIRNILFENYLGGIRYLRNTNILSGACGILCPTNRLCQAKCVLGEVSAPIQIGALQTYLMGIDWTKGYSLKKILVEREDKEPTVAVVGAGPAGVSAAVELQRLGESPVIFDASGSVGGLIGHGIPAYKINEAYIDYEIEWLAAQVRVQKGQLGEDLEIGRLMDRFEALVICCGSEASRYLALARDDAENIVGAREFFVQPPSSLKDMRVVVIGGGDVATDAAILANHLGAARIDVLCLEMPHQMFANPINVNLALGRGIFFSHGTKLLEILVRNGMPGGIRACRIVWKEPGLVDPENAIEIDGTEFFLPVDYVIFAIGSCLSAKVSRCLQRENIALSNGLIYVDDEHRTSVPGVFACGDAISTKAPRLLVHAVGEGKQVAYSIKRFLKSKRDNHG